MKGQTKCDGRINAVTVVVRKQCSSTDNSSCVANVISIGTGERLEQVLTEIGNVRRSTHSDGVMLQVQMGAQMN